MDKTQRPDVGAAPDASTLSFKPGALKKLLGAGLAGRADTHGQIAVQGH